MAPYSHAVHPDPVIRSEAQHDQKEAFDWNVKRVEAAKKEFRNPIKGLLASIRDNVLGVLRGTGKFATDLVTHPLAAVANAGRWALDVTTKLPARVAIATSDIVSENTFGRISRFIRAIREKIHKALEPKTHGHGPATPGNGHEAHAKAGH